MIGRPLKPHPSFARIPDRLDLVAVRVEDEAGVIVRIVLRAQTGWAGVAAAMAKGRLVELIDDRPPAGGEGDVYAVAGRAGLSSTGVSTLNKNEAP
jgi:hypothetical protein